MHIFNSKLIAITYIKCITNFEHDAQPEDIN